MKALFLLILIAGGIYVHHEMNEPSSPLRQNVMEFMNEIQNGQPGGHPGGAVEIDYASTAAGRPSLIGYEARATGEVGERPEPVQQWGRTKDLSTAYDEYRRAYSAYMDAMAAYGEFDARTRAALEEYYQAKYQYDALNLRAR